MNCREYTINKVFIRRWSDHIHRQIGIMRSVVDLIVLIYIGVPALLLFGRFYYGLWHDQLPLWMINTPIYIIPILLFALFQISGRLILYIEAADVLFMKQHPKWTQGIMGRGMIVECCKQLVLITIFIILLLPLLIRQFHLEFVSILILLMFTFGMRMIYSFSTNLLQIYLSGWRRAIGLILVSGVHGLAYVIFSLYLMDHVISGFVISGVCMVLSALLAFWRLRVKGAFEAEIREEERQKTRLTSFLLSGSVEKPSVQWSRPWLFRSGRRLFRSNKSTDIVAELIFKSFFRSSDCLLYCQFIAFGTIAVIPTIMPVNIIVFFALIFLLSHWLKGYSSQFMNQAILSILQFDSSLKYAVAQKASKLLLLPGVVILTIGLIWSLIRT